jgi:WD40 repeat protein
MSHKFRSLLLAVLLLLPMGILSPSGLSAQDGEPKSPGVRQLPWSKSYGVSTYSLAFSPDGKTLASAGGWTIQLWDLATHAERARLKGHTTLVKAVAFSPDGKTLASASSRGNSKSVEADEAPLRLWDVETGQERLALKGHRHGVTCVAFSPDGKLLASGAEDKRVKLWDVATGMETATFDEHIDEVNAVAFSPDGTRLASGCGKYYASGKLLLRDVATGKVQITPSNGVDRVKAVAFSPDGTTLASAIGGFLKKGGTVQLWEVATGNKLAALAGTMGHHVTCLAISPDGKILAAGNTDNTITLWDMATGQERSRLTGHLSTPIALAFSPDGKTLASSADSFDRDKAIRLWDVQP